MAVGKSYLDLYFDFKGVFTLNELETLHLLWKFPFTTGPQAGIDDDDDDCFTHTEAIFTSALSKYELSHPRCFTAILLHIFQAN